MSLKIRRILDLQKKMSDSDNIPIRIRTPTHPYSLQTFLSYQRYCQLSATITSC